MKNDVIHCWGREGRKEGGRKRTRAEGDEGSYRVRGDIEQAKGGGREGGREGGRADVPTEQPLP